ncbi:MAG TPA: 5-formyltetrahydrofolate cyclo-ligase [Candidatus Omnitrophota bacterium]|nr:5-formyltetrahydrofolate cyclo-ligase [Candidatus Omnitrophota bacterium]
MKKEDNLSGKQQLRASMLSQLSKLKEVDRADKSFSIQQKLFETLEFKKAKIILFYASLKTEVETDRMIKEAQAQGKLIGLPVVLEKNLVPFLAKDFPKNLHLGPYDIRQPKKEFSHPVSLADIDLVIVPGIAFDNSCNRLGRGKGYYDRFLKTLPKETATIGLAFDFQIVDNLPHSSIDLPVNKIIVS